MKHVPEKEATVGGQPFIRLTKWIEWSLITTTLGNVQICLFQTNRKPVVEHVYDYISYMFRLLIVPIFRENFITKEALALKGIMIDFIWRYVMASNSYSNDD